jgi:hypothetical protein
LQQTYTESLAKVRDIEILADFVWNPDITLIDQLCGCCAVFESDEAEVERDSRAICAFLLINVADLDWSDLVEYLSEKSIVDSHRDEADVNTRLVHSNVALGERSSFQIMVEDEACLLFD